ncbi:uncharacterized protein LOC141803144 [Halichoeres trimaculatus]|uniref:uncharacterized protein LOC141803144 n=1 Tax=Halichoeres trimaculatus TaxID=147232 RepID=UPI003D9EE16D
MQAKRESCGGPACSSWRCSVGRGTTFLAKIAVVLQRTPGKMLIFAQLMDRMVSLVGEDTQALRNNLRVCLSTNKCFVKIPIVPATGDSKRTVSKRNYWKLDLNQVTAKMVRRHFKGILHLFPELACEGETDTSSRVSKQCCSAPLSPEPSEPSVSGDVQIRCEVKFSSPFSIESILKRDSPSPRALLASPLCSVPVRAEQRVGTKRRFSWDSEQLLFLQASAGSSSVCSAGGSTHRGLAKPLGKTHEPSFLYTRAAAHYSSPNSSYITYSVPAFTHDALRFRL